MENKVKFHALERLDLVDVNALQDNMYTYMAKAFGNLIGNASGLLQLPDTITINSSLEHIEFSDFIYIEAQDDTDYAYSFENRMIAHDESLANGNCSYDLALQDVQDYYDSNNNTLPTFNSANASLFPYIWVLKNEVETTQDSRRFWDTSNNVETTNLVVTRKKYTVNFLLSATTPAGGYTAIGRIIDWDVNNNVVELPNANQSIELYTFADDIYFSNGSYHLENSSEYNGMADQMGGGLKLALKAIRKQIADIRGNGSGDSAYSFTPTLFNGLPNLSLDGLYARTADIEDRIADNKKGSVIFTLISDPANDSHTIETDFYTNANRSFVLDSGVSAYYDYEFLHTLPSTTAISSWTTANYWSLANSVLAIDFGDTYSGYGIRMSVDVVNALALKEDAPNHFMRPIHAQPFSDDITSGANYNDIFKVSSNTYQNLSDTSTAFKGVKVSLTGLFDYFEDVYDTPSFTTVVRIPVKIDFELIKP